MRTAAQVPGRARMPRGPAAPMSAAVSIHCCERTASPLRARARPGLRTAERISERTAALCGASSSIRRISTSNSRSRGGSSAMSASSPASTARSISFTWAARIASVEPNSPRRSASETPARLRDLGEADLLDRLLGKQRHESVDDAVALGSIVVARWRAPRDRLCFGFARHDGTPGQFFLPSM